MFDEYLPMKLGTRMAMEGEELIAHRFSCGAIGLVPRSDFERWRCSAMPAVLKSGQVGLDTHEGFWQAIKSIWMEFLTFYGFIGRLHAAAHGEPGPVVAIPSDALLRVFGICSAWQERYHLGAFEDALLVEQSLASDVSHSALCFGNGVVVPLRLLREGQRLKVLRRSWSESLDPDPQRVQAD